LAFGHVVVLVEHDGAVAGALRVAALVAVARAPGLRSDRGGTLGVEPAERPEDADEVERREAVLLHEPSDVRVALHPRVGQAEAKDDRRLRAALRQLDPAHRVRGLRVVRVELGVQAVDPSLPVARQDVGPGDRSRPAGDVFLRLLPVLLLLLFRPRIEVRERKR
jgi:hypothetical protein